MIIATATIRDPFISGHTRWETNEKAKASPTAELSAIGRVSVWPLRLLLTTTGLVLSTVQRTHGNRTSTMATRTTTIRTIRTMFEPLGYKIKYVV